MTAETREGQRDLKPKAGGRGFLDKINKINEIGGRQEAVTSSGSLVAGICSGGL